MNKSIFPLIGISIMLSGCNSSISPDNTTPPEIVPDTNENIQSISEASLSKTEPVPTEDKTNYTDAVDSFYNKYMNILSDYYPAYTLSDVSKDSLGESKFYKFDIETGGMYSQPQVVFQDTSSSFKMSLPDKIDNNILKNIIQRTLMCLQDNIDENMAFETMQTIVNGFNGSENGEIVSFNGHKIYISAPSGLIPRYLYVIADNEINPAIDTAEYIAATNDLFNGELNVGEKVFLNGSIINMTDLGNDLWGLEITNNSNAYIVYYNPISFIDCFDINETHTFYGTIASPRNGYAGCLRLEHII